MLKADSFTCAVLLNIIFSEIRFMQGVCKSETIFFQNEKEWRTRFSPNANLVAGGFGGLCSLVVGYPFDTVKVRLQTANNLAYKNSFDCLSKMVLKEGFMSLFRGLSGLACVALPRFALMFHSNTVARNLLMKPDQKNNYPRVMLSGAFSQLLGKLPFHKSSTY